MSNTNVSFHYHGNFTFAYALDGNRDAINRRVVVGFAYLSPKDRVNASRARGRVIAEGRLNKRPVVLDLKVDPTVGGIRFQVLEALHALAEQNPQRHEWERVRDTKNEEIWEHVVDRVNPALYHMVNAHYHVCKLSDLAGESPAKATAKK